VAAEGGRAEAGSPGEEDVTDKDRPPKLPTRRHPLHNGDARQAGRFLLNWAARRPRVPLAPSAKYWLEGCCYGRHPCSARRYLAILEYVSRRKAELLLPERASLRISIGPNGLRLGRS